MNTHSRVAPELSLSPASPKTPPSQSLPAPGRRGATPSPSLLGQGRCTINWAGQAAGTSPLCVAGAGQPELQEALESSWERGQEAQQRLNPKRGGQGRAAGAPASGQRAILLLPILQPRSASWAFFFSPLKKGWFLHFHSSPIEKPGYKRGCEWLLPPGASGPSSNHRMATPASESSGKWQWLG